MTESVRIEAGPDGVRFPDLDLTLAYPAREHTESRIIAETSGLVIHNEFQLFLDDPDTPYLVIEAAKPRVTEPERAS